MHLELNLKKTKVVHTLWALADSQEVGFHFLGFHVRQYPLHQEQAGKGTGQSLRFKTLIKPSKEAVKHHLPEIRQGVEGLQNAPQAALIGKLNPLIQGWTNYNRTVVAKEEFNRCDAQLYGKLRAWAQHRHPNKSATWVARKYWGVSQGKGWQFMTQKGQVLKTHAATPIKRHVKVRGAASPYDGNLIYWAQRLQAHPLLNSRVGSLLKVQKGRCAYCGLTLRDGDLLEVDHIIPRSLGGDDTRKNLQVMHRHCHDQKTAKDGSNRQDRGIDDNDSLTEEPDARKRASPVLKWGRGR